MFYFLLSFYVYVIFLVYKQLAVLAKKINKTINIERHGLKFYIYCIWEIEISEYYISVITSINRLYLFQWKNIVMKNYNRATSYILGIENFLISTHIAY